MSQYLFKWKHFESEIIISCVRWYLKYPLSYRRLVEMMQEWGLNLTHTAIMRWVHQYSPIISEKVQKHLRPTNDSWRMDETHLQIKGRNAYLYRAVDSKGKTNEMFYSGIISVKTVLRKVKYLNNIIEQDHRFIKRKIRLMLGFDSFETAEKTICGIETFHMIRKGQIEENRSALSEVTFFNKVRRAHGLTDSEV